jgi:diguanylate cyclase (GGDEF)-like protein
VGEGFKDETVVTSIGTLEGIAVKEPALDFLGGPSMGQQIILQDRDYVFGRSRDADVVVEDEAISRYHFKVKVKDKVVTIEDMESTNGTFVNGVRVKQQVLNSNDKVQISSVTVLRFSYVDLIDKNTHERFYEMALFDPVTTAHTKRYFLDRICHEFAHSKRRNLPLSLVIFDLDHFKKVNDTYGHPAGDFVLQKVSEITKQLIRNEDIFARYGGEEFVILMRDTDEKSAVKLAERLRRKIEQARFGFEEHRIPVTVSLGVASSVDNNFSSHDDLVREADKHLYQSKIGGRNRVSAPSLSL